MQDYHLQRHRPSVPVTPTTDPAPVPGPQGTTFSTSGFLAGVWTEIRASNFADYLRQIAFIESLPKHCGLCGSSQLTPRHRRVREFEFFEIGCTGCNAVFSLSRRRDDGTLFPNWKRGWLPGWSPSDPPEGAAG